MKSNHISQIFNTPFSYWQGLYFYRQNKWKRAQKFFEKSVDISPNNPYCNFKLGMCFFKQKKWELAFQFISKAVEIQPNIIDWHVQLRQSETKVKLLLCKKQLKTFDSIIQNQNGNATITNAVAAHIEENILLEQLSLDKDNLKLNIKLAELLYSQNKFWQVIDLWKKIIQLIDDNSQYYYKLGETYEKLSNYELASESYKEAINRYARKKDIDPVWFYHLGYVLEKIGDPESSGYYQLAVNYDKKLNAKTLGVGVFHYARRYWNCAIAEFKKLEESQPTADLYYKIGFSYDRCAQWSLAEEYYEKSLKLSLKPEWQFRLGFVQEKQKKFALAAENYQNAAEISKKYIPYWFYRCAYCLEQLENYKAASSMYMKLRKEQDVFDKNVPSSMDEIKDFIVTLENHLENDTTDENIWYQLGCAYEIVGNIDLAYSAYQQAVARSNDLLSVWYYRLGVCAVKLKQYKDACNALKNYRVMQRAHGESENILQKNDGFAQSAAYDEYYDVLSIKPKTVLYESFSGQSMSCNPYALFISLLGKKGYEDWTHIWVISDKKNIPEEYRKNKNIIFIQKNSDVYLRYLASTYMLVNNSTFPSYFVRKENQKYINTWHGTPFKTLGNDMKGRFFEHKNFTRNILQATHILSPNPHTSKIINERHDIKNIYTGKIIETGYPRIDLTIRSSVSKKLALKNRLGLNHDYTVIFYAPTWRGTHENIEFNIDKLISDITQLSLLPNSKIIFRGHSLLQDMLAEKILDKDINVLVPSGNIDTNELLSITDILITDYSSILFDYLPTLNPLVLYMYDFYEYKEERGLYFHSSELPGYKCYDIDSLIYILQKILQNKPVISCQDNFIDTFAPHDNGMVSDKVWDIVFNDNYNGVCIVNPIPDKKSILIYGGPLMGNGITTSFINLLSNIDKEKYTVTLIVEPGAIEREESRLVQFSRIPEHINIIARVGRMNLSLEERYIHGLNNQDYCLPSENANSILLESWKAEYRRIFGYAKFDTLIHFEGYNRFWAGVFSSMQHNCNTIIFMHNSMYDEYKLKYPYLKSIFGYCRFFNKVVSVSKLTMNLNQKNLSLIFDIPEEKFDYCDNLQHPEYILSKSAENLLVEDQKYFDGKGKVFVSIGRLSVEKDHKKLVDAFYKIVKQYPFSKLLIVGEGALKYALLEQIQNLNLQDNVFLLGGRYNPFPILKHADCFILSSNHEGQPMTLFEAMVLEKNIIATDIVGSRSVVEGRSGYLVENSVNGLAQGMLDLIEGKLPLIKYNIDTYQKNAMNKFDSLV